LSLGDGCFILEHILEHGGAVDDHARRQRRDGDLERLVAERPLALDKPVEENVPWFEELDGIAEDWKRVRRTAA
jgi:hypothetical protein